jgi:hypothetical protein
MGTLLGFVVGHALGARRGEDGHAGWKQAIDRVLDSPELKALVDRGAALTEQLGGARDGSAGDSGIGDRARALFEGDGRIRASWRDIADSDTLQTIVATGLSFVGDLFDRGKALLEERGGRGSHRRD